MYFDNNATTPMSPQTIEVYRKSLAVCANPSASNQQGKEAATAIENVRKMFTKYCGLKDTKIIFTSGATESNCLILRSMVASFYVALEKRSKTIAKFKPHIICSEIEHHSILECLDSMMIMIEVSLVQPDECGRITADAVSKLIKKNTLLISVMAANNETGVINEIENIGKLAKKNKIPFHTDATQLFGKHAVGTNFADAVSISCHKWHGPKGVGVLLIRDSLIKNYELRGQISGTQQFGLRGGTENVPGIIAAGSAFMQNFSGRTAKNEKLAKMRDTLLEALRKNYTVLDHRDIKSLAKPQDKKEKVKIVIIGCGLKLENTVLLSIIKYDFCNIKFKKALEKRGVVCSIGSACNTKNPSPSHVLFAMKIPDFVRSGVLRISFGDQNTLKEVKKFCEILTELI